MAHFIERNHSPRFWAVVAQLYPDYPQRRQELNREHRYLQALLRRLYAPVAGPAADGLLVVGVGVGSSGLMRRPALRPAPCRVGPYALELTDTNNPPAPETRAPPPPPAPDLPGAGGGRRADARAAAEPRRSGGARHRRRSDMALAGSANSARVGAVIASSIARYCCFGTANRRRQGLPRIGTPDVAARCRHQCAFDQGIGGRGAQRIGLHARAPRAVAIWMHLELLVVERRRASTARRRSAAQASAGRASGPSASISTKRRIRSGYAAATSVAMAPPIECPIRSNCPGPAPAPVPAHR